MEIFYDLIRFFHVISFVFMCVLLFNLIVANERVLLGITFNYNADRHIEDIIKSGVNWCYINQSINYSVYRGIAAGSWRYWNRSPVGRLDRSF